MTQENKELLQLLVNMAGELESTTIHSMRQIVPAKYYRSALRLSQRQQRADRACRYARNRHTQLSGEQILRCYDDLLSLSLDGLPPRFRSCLSSAQSQRRIAALHEALCDVSDNRPGPEREAGEKCHHCVSWYRGVATHQG